MKDVSSLDFTLFSVIFIVLVFSFSGWSLKPPVILAESKHSL